MISALVKYVRRHGIRRTVAYTLEIAGDRFTDWIDNSFDRRYGTDTGGIIDDMAALEVGTDRSESARGYQGIQILVFRRILRDLRSLGIAPGGFTFVDFGSGKGRAVMMAAEKQFAAIHGVELSPVLHAVAESNVARFRAKNVTAGPISLRCLDATAFEIPPGDLVAFFYNPFDAEVLSKVLANIESAYVESANVESAYVDAASVKSPRRLIIVYRNPRHADAFSAHPHLRRVHVSADYQIYARAA